MSQRLVTLMKGKTALAMMFYITLFFNCTSSTILTTRYAPFHPGNNAQVEFRIEATDMDGIATVELFIFEYELFLNSEGEEDARRRTGGTWGLVNTWSYETPPTSIDETYDFTAGFPAGSYVKYIAQITDSDANVKNESWEFAAGTWPFGNSPIPIWKNDGDLAERLDVAFIADEDDYSNARDMLPDLQSLIFEGYHQNNGIKLGKVFWQFYYSPELGGIDISAIEFDIPESVETSAKIDYGAVIHTSNHPDWTDFRFFSSEPDEEGTAVHETGHAVFGLSDEYSLGKHDTSTEPHHNIYRTLGSCQTYNNANGFPPGDCELVTDDLWRPEPASLNCIMRDDDANGVVPNFARTCIERIKWFYSTL